ncbi:MAG: uridine monophosphate kinase [Oscillospiraceae bacterium]|jgi:uridylate kinase|nr:uridine monophosphate kinase [Oscillospiraceae bacterium]
MMRRVLVKLSGEALGRNGTLFDLDRFDESARSLKTIADGGVQLGVVIGAGNLWRGRRGGAERVSPVAADHIGMTGTLMNALQMQDALIRAGAKARTLCAFDVPRFAEPFTQRGAQAALNAGEIVLLAGGTGHPFFSTDTGVALRAVELKADMILLAKNVDGVYDKDPNKHPGAVMLPRLTYDQAISRNLGVMDMTALVLCRDNRVPMIRVFGLKEPDGLVRAAQGDISFGSVVEP